MDKNQALVPVESLDVVKVFTVDGELDAILNDIEQKAMAHVPVLDTEQGKKDIASMAYRVARSKTLLDGMGKDLVADWKTKAKKVDSVRKHCRDFLDDLKEKVRQPLTELEEREVAERAQRRKEMERLEDWDEAITQNDLIDREREVARKEAEMAAAEQARLEKERAEKAERDRKDREAQIAKEAAAAAERKAQQAIADAKAAKEQAEKDRLQAIEDAKAEKQAAIERERQKARDEADRIERERIAAEAEKKRIAAEEKAKAERLAAHKSHRKKIEKEAAMGFAENCAVDFVVGLAFVEAIEKGLIPHVTINY